MAHYKSNVRDIQFNLFEYNRTQDVMGSGTFEDMDEETARNVLLEVEKLAKGAFAESFEPGTGLRLLSMMVTSRCRRVFAPR